jgi:hypothetical protein
MKILILIFSFAFLFVSLRSQNTTYYSFEQALINDNVRSIEEDINGNIWVGTISGITVFDGINFTSYTSADGLGGNIVYDICAHSSGDVYAATSGGISKFDGITWTNTGMGDGLPSNTIWSVEEDNYGNIWIGTSNMGVVYYDGLIWTAFNTSDGLVSNGVKTILVDRSDNVWFGTGNGLSVYNGSSFKTHNTTTGLPGLLVNEIIQLYNGNIAVATNGGIGIYNYHEWESITTTEGLPAANVLSLREDYNQNLWIGSAAGLTKYDGSSFETYTYNDGLTNTIVSKHIITHAGDNKIWCGSPFNGISVFDFENDFIIYRTNRNLVSDEITTIYTDYDDITWVGTTAGLNKIDDQHWRTFTALDGLSNDEITAIHKDINGNVWVGTVDGLNKITGGTITQINTGQGLTNSYVNSITSDNAGVVYVATQDKVTIITEGVVSGEISTTDGLIDNNVDEIHFENDRLWFIMYTAIQFYESAVFTDATLSGCAESQDFAGAKCLNNTTGQYFGTDYTLRYFEDGLTISNCVLHPYSGTSNMTSIVDLPSGVVCSFDNGEVQLYNGVWVPYPIAFDVSFLSTSFDDNYLWVGATDQGLAKICLNCTSDITADLTSPSCHETNDGVINITSPAGTSYSIDNGENWQASAVFNSQSGGLKHILVKNALGNIIADSVIFLPYYDQISDANITITQILCNGNNSGEIVLEYSNSGSHIWENANTVLYERTNLGAGIYSVTIYDSGSCSRILSNEIIEPEALDIDISHTDITCFDDADGEIVLSVSGGTIPYSYDWSNSETTSTISNLEPSNYLYTVTDGNGCTETGSQEIIQPDELIISQSITHNSCYGDLSGIIDITITGGITPYEITWDDDTYVNGGFDIINAPAGFYNVTVSDDHNCSTSASYEITEPEGIDIISEDLLHVHCFGESTGEIDIEVSGGVGTLNYEWVKEGVGGVFSTDQDIIELSSGTYHLTITDENFCETNTSYLINQSPLLDVNITITPITCAGYDDGELLAVASGGTGIYSAYYWYNDNDDIIGVNPHITGLTGGDYYIICRDSYYCYDTAYATLTQAVPHVYEISSTDMTCNGLENGTITVIVDGGSGLGYTFNWEGGIAGNTNIATNVGTGTWSVTVTDPTDCTEILEETVSEPEMLDIGYFDEYAYICYGNTLILNPGTFVSYHWSTGSTNPTIEVENEDLYFVEVVDATGCHLGDTVFVVVSTVINDEEINLATVTDDETIKIMWEKTPNQGTELYKIYRDAGDGFEFITNLDYTEPAIYEDFDVSPSDQYYKYRITSVDSCGAESDYSVHHRTCLLDVVPDNNGVCYLNWAGYQGFFVVYYFIMSGDSPETLEVVDSVLYSTFNYVEMNPDEDGTYYRIKVRRIDGCSPGDGEYYDEAYSNIVYCDNISGVVNTVINDPMAYPNPFNDEINIDFFLNIGGEVKYSIVNMLGQFVYDETIYNANSGNQTIKLNPDLDAGIYILKLSYGNEIHNFRIVKN